MACGNRQKWEGKEREGVLDIQNSGPCYYQASFKNAVSKNLNSWASIPPAVLPTVV